MTLAPRFPLPHRNANYDRETKTALPPRIPTQSARPATNPTGRVSEATRAAAVDCIADARRQHALTEEHNAKPERIGLRRNVASAVCWSRSQNLLATAGEAQSDLSAASDDDYSGL